MSGLLRSWSRRGGFSSHCHRQRSKAATISILSPGGIAVRLGWVVPKIAQGLAVARSSIDMGNCVGVLRWFVVQR